MKRIKRVYEYPSNVPRKLIMKFREAKHNERELSRRLGVNVGHISKLLNKGIEPKDELIRSKMLFPKSRMKPPAKIKRPKKSSEYKRMKPYYIVQWEHLPKEERHAVILNYMETKSMLKNHR